MQYLASTPDGAWAELLRHEEIRDPVELQGIERALWAVELDERTERLAEPKLPARILLGGPASYPACRREARRLRAGGFSGLSGRSAALVPGGDRGQQVHGGLREAPARDGRVLCLFGPRPALRGFLCAEAPPTRPRLLALVRSLDGSSERGLS